MATLYEVLNEITEDNPETENFKPDEIQQISKELEKRVKKKIGASEYKTLETYVIKNKDDEYLKELTEALEMQLLGAIFSLAFGNLSEAKQEVVIGYKLTTKLYEKLKASNYDAEQALLDLYC